MVEFNIREIQFPVIPIDAPESTQAWMREMEETMRKSLVGSIYVETMIEGGNFGIGTRTAGSKLAVVGLINYADNAAAITGGLAAGDFYRTGGDPDLVCVVH